MSLEFRTACTRTYRPTARDMIRARLLTGTALAGIALAMSAGLPAQEARAQAATPDLEVGTAIVGQYFLEQEHAGGGVFHLSNTGSITDNGPSQAALSSDASPAAAVGWTMNIDGQISATGSNGVGIGSYADETITIGSSGVVQANNATGGTGISSINGVSIDNSGQISGGFAAIMAGSGSLSLINREGASIQGITQMTSVSGGTVDNAGLMNSTSSLGHIVLQGDATVYNRATGVITSDSNALFIKEGSGSVENWGEITTRSLHGANSAVYLYNSGSAINHEGGTISGAIGIRFGNSAGQTTQKATLTNSGSITGTAYYPVLFQKLDEASLTNTATGNLEGLLHGVFLTDVTAGEIINAGTIKGATAITLSGTTKATIHNSGRIESTDEYAINKNATSSYDLTLDTGSNIIGKVKADSGDTLTLKGSGSEDEDLQGFGTLTMAGAAWTLSGAVQADTLDLTSGALTLTGSNIDFGSITVANTAKLIVNGSFASPVTTTLSGGARLGGTGTVGETTVNSGGILSPGNSIGTLNVAGDATFNAGSIYEVEVDPAGAASDKTIASGAIIINGGTVRHIGLSGTYSPTATYRILEGGTGLSGSFDNVASDYAFLTPELIYDRANYTVDLKLARNDISFADKVATANQMVAAAAVETLGLGNAVFDAAAVLPDNAAVLGAAFDSLSGEIHASLQSTMIETGSQLRDAVNDRLRTTTTGGVRPSAPLLGYAPTAGSSSPTGKVLAAPDSEDATGWAVWARGFGGWTTKDGNGNAAALTYSNAGVLIGADLDAFDSVRLGVFGGYGRTDINVRARGSSGTVDSYHVGAYGGTSWAAGSGLLALRSGLSYTWNDVDTSRNVAVGALGGTPTAGYRATAVQAFAEAGYSFDMGAAKVEPFAGLAYIGLRTDGFNEAGGAAALAGQKSDMDTLFSTLGARGATSVTLGTLPLELTGAIGWRHAFGDVTPVATSSFAGGSPFSVAGTPIARDAALLEAGIGVALAERARFALGYKGQIAEDAREHAVTMRISARF
jgi:outer membrane autotransporter protein